MTPRQILLLHLALLLPFATVAGQDEPFRAPPSRPVDVKSIDLDLQVDLEKKSVSGSALLHVEALRDVRGVRLNAVDHRITSVTHHSVEGAAGAGAGALVPFSYDGKELVIERALKRGEAAAFVVSYSVVEPKTGLHFFAPTEDEPRVPYQVWSQGESTTNRYWFPCVDHPDERQTTSITAHVKQGLTVVSNGKLLGKGPSSRGDGLVAWRYSQQRPHVAYLVSLVVGTFDSATDEWKGKPLGYYVPPGRKDDIQRSFGRTKDMLDYFSKLIGIEYPWTKYDQVVVEQFSAGGMENTGATTLNERTLHDARAHLDYSSEGLVAHELAHQWYGDLLTCRDWSHLWLNESFATYFAALWEEHARGRSDHLYAMLRASERGMKAGKKRPILDRRYRSPGSMFDGRAYPKGSCVLHMLRQQLGDEAFWRGIRAYTLANKDRGVETDDLRRALERSSGHNLERFFRDWTGRPGHPVLKVSLKRDAERGLLTVRIQQKQESEAYAFPAELEFWFGEEKLVRTFEVSGKDERFVLAESRQPTRFRFDPREAVLLKEVTVEKGRDLWIAQLQRDGTIGRIRAARALAKQDRPEVRKALREALVNDPFWGVRAEIAKVLPKQDDESRAALIASLEKDPHPKARRACAEALGARGRDPKAAVALREALQRGDKSYYVVAAITESLARASAESTPELVALLEAHLKQPSHNEVIRTAVVRGLRGFDDPSVIPTFAKLTGPGNHHYVRREASRALSVAALPGASEDLVKQAVAALRAVLRRSRGRGKRAALDGLKALGSKAREALPEVEALAAQDPSERVRNQAEQTAEALRAGEPPQRELKRLREQNKELQGRLKKLEEERDTFEARLKRLEEKLSQQGK